MIVSDWQSSLQSVFKGLLSIFYPSVCPGCGLRTSHDFEMCPQCWQQFHFIEKPYCPIMGTPFSYELSNGMLSAEVLVNPPPFKRARAVARHEGLARQMISGLKFYGQTSIAPVMAHWMKRAAPDLLHDCDMIIPMPLHPKRLRKRGYNQSAEIARHLAKFCNLAFKPYILQRVRYTVPQVGLDASARRLNVRQAFQVPDHYCDQIVDKHILLIDDVYTTGATAYAAAEACLKAKCASVDLLTFTRVLPSN